MVRLGIVASIMLPILAAVMLSARVPDALAAVGAVRRVLRRRPPSGDASPPQNSHLPQRATPVTYSEVDHALATGKVPELSERPSGAPPGRPDDPTTRIPRTSADEFQPDVAAAPRPPAESAKHAQTAAHPPSYSGTPSNLGPGATVADGRYRLLVFHGGPPELQFWQALDVPLDRQVALTLIDPDRRMPDAQIDEILARTLTLSRIQRPGLARVLDVTKISASSGVSDGSGLAIGSGLVVSEWIRGGSLREVADTSPSPLGAARAIQSLAAAADEAHRAGVALSVDHPGRVRVSIDGDVALAFPATLAGATPAGDVRGIGASLYALLVDRWPLPEHGTSSGLRPADTAAAGEPIDPSTVNAAIPFQISAAASRAIQPGGGISTAATLLHLLQQATAAADRTDLMEPVGDTAPRTSRRIPSGQDAAALQRRKLLIGLGVGAAVLLVALAVMASLLGRIFGDTSDGLKSDQLGLNTTTAPSVSATGAIVKPVAAEVFSPDGGADAPSLAGLAIDGDQSTAWPTDTYTDTVPFPNFKNGVGLMLELPEPTVVGSVTVAVSSAGTQVQIRSSPTASPADLQDTILLTGPTALKPGTNTISVPSAGPTSHLLVWISTMGQTAGESRTDVSEITVRAAS
jgi:putative peptidoglycan lipid II flippase